MPVTLQAMCLVRVEHGRRWFVFGPASCSTGWQSYSCCMSPIDTVASCWPDLMEDLSESTRELC